MRRVVLITLGIIGLLLIVFVFVWSKGANNPQTSIPGKTDVAINETTTQTPTATEVLETVVGNDRISEAKYFASNTWLVGTTSSSTEGAIETYMIVAKLSNGRWAAVDVGSFIDTELLRLAGAPPDLIYYLEGVQ